MKGDECIDLLSLCTTKIKKNNNVIHRVKQFLMLVVNTCPHLC